MAGCNQAGPITPKIFFATAKQKRPPEGRPLLLRIHRLIAVDNNRTTVAVVVTVAVPPDNHRFVATSAVPIPKMFTVTIAIAVTTTFTHGHATRTYPDSDFFRSNRNCAANTHHGSYGDCVLDHDVLL
jgi:hypothetical protein